jgi:hypothetical protein
MNKQIIILLFMIFSAGLSLPAQNLSQTIKGRVSDKESQIPLAGAHVYIDGSDPILATATDANGNYKLQNVPVGRHTITVSFMGYAKVSIPEILVGSGKEVVLNVDLKEEISRLDEVVVHARKSKGDVMNSMASVSARSFNVEEARRYAGGLDDPARLASAFAGVSSSGNMESNAIIIRGNAPSGVMWQIEGVEVSVPSHFANADVMGGGAITLFSNQMLSNSDFFTGAFPAEYGNALSGVFDIKLRTGNNEKKEYSFSLGVLGIDASAEGPLGRGSKASYLINYRYATFGLVKQLLPDQGLPVYQDLCFKLNLPTKKAGNFTLWGIGGIDNFKNNAENDPKNWDNDHARLDLDSWFYPGSAGLGHKIIIGRSTYIQSIASVSSYSASDNSKWVTDDLEHKPIFNSTYNEFKYTFRSTVNHKFNARLTGRLGVIGNLYTYDYTGKRAYRTSTGVTDLKTINTGSGNSTSYQAFSQFKCDISKKLSMNVGVHSLYFVLNKSYSIEPRAGVRYSFNNRHALGLAYGSHSQMQMLTTYLIEKQENGMSYYPNKKLELSKAQHWVLSYDYNINEIMRLKVEPYYQSLSDIPVTENSSFSMINLDEGQGFDKILVSKGTGTNYGVDLTLERFLNKGFYYLITTSLFESKYKGGDGIERNTMYNSNYIVNLLAGKEWKVGKSGRNNLFGISGRLYLRGGDRKNPVNIEESMTKHEIVYDETRAFSNQNPMMYRFDISVNYRINRANISHVFAVQLNNAFFSPTLHDDIYDYSTNSIREIKSGDPFPSVSWKIEF